MVLSILRDVAGNIQNGVFYTIMADEVRDSSSQEQSVLCLTWMDEDLNPHKKLIGLYLVPSMCLCCSGMYSECLNSYELGTQKLQWYDGASNM